MILHVKAMAWESGRLFVYFYFKSFLMTIMKHKKEVFIGIILNGNEYNNNGYTTKPNDYYYYSEAKFIDK